MGGGFNPALWFAAGEQGAWYDPSDFSTMFQDAAGTTPVTAVEQPVGKMLDKSGRGNHASQVTAASRPVLSARKNPLTYTEQLNNAAWTNGGTATTPAATTVNLPAVNDYVWHSLVASTYAGKQVTVSATLSGSGTVVLGAYDNVSAFQFSSITLTSTPTRYSVTVTIGTGAVDVRAIAAGRLSDATATTLTATNIQVDFGSTATTYQRVTTSTDYDTVGFPHYLAFDGVDDFLSTGNIDFTGTNKLTVIASVRKDSDAATSILFELSANAGANAGAFFVAAPSTASANYGFALRGSALAQRDATIFSAPCTNLIFCAFDLSKVTRAGSIIPRVDAATPTLANISAEDVGGGNFGSYPLHIGRRNDASLPFTGRIYRVIVIGRELSAAERNAAEAWCAEGAGLFFF